jgi:hypothetical protein
MQTAFKYWSDKAALQPATYDLNVPFSIDTMGGIDYIAASPTELRTSVSGSALPFTNMQQAMELSPNKGTVHVSRGTLGQLPLAYPNSFYIGSHKVCPVVFLRWRTLENTFAYSAIKLGQSVPFRALFPSNTKHEDTRHEIVSGQEAILRRSAYPSSL